MTLEDRLYGDPLKPLADLTTPDSRNVGSPAFGTRRIEDHYADVDAHRLNDSVPRDTWQHFETARTVYAFAWFSYRLFHVADLHALGSLELALRLRFAISNRGPGLNALLKRATSEQLLVDSAMRMWIRRQSAIEQQRAEEAAWPEAFRRLFGRIEQAPTPIDPQRFVRNLSVRLPAFRNELAHGSPYLYPQRAIVLELCSDLINQLFPTLSPEPSTAEPG